MVGLNPKKAPFVRTEAPPIFPDLWDKITAFILKKIISVGIEDPAVSKKTKILSGLAPGLSSKFPQNPSGFFPDLPVKLSTTNASAAIDTGTTLIGKPSDDVAALYAAIPQSRQSQGTSGFYEFRMYKAYHYPGSSEYGVKWKHADDGRQRSIFFRDSFINKSV